MRRVRARNREEHDSITKDKGGEYDGQGVRGVESKGSTDGENTEVLRITTNYCVLWNFY